MDEANNATKLHYTLSQSGCIISAATDFSSPAQVKIANVLHSFVPPAQAPSSPGVDLRRSLLAWPAWLRVLAVSPVLALLWLAVAWAAEAAPW